MPSTRKRCNRCGDGRFLLTSEGTCFRCWLGFELDPVSVEVAVETFGPNPNPHRELPGWKPTEVPESLEAWCRD